MLRLILAFILISMVLRAVSRLVRGITDGMGPPRQTPPPAVALARDPVCGTYVVPAKALTAGQGADMRFFCSEKCRRAWQVKPAPPWPSR
jgi:YHS domain-containing protein